LNASFFVKLKSFSRESLSAVLDEGLQSSRPTMSADDSEEHPAGGIRARLALVRLLLCSLDCCADADSMPPIALRSVAFGALSSLFERL
jgi:hypothetical protein